MIQVSDEQFAEFIGEAMDDLAHKVAADMDNVAIVWEDEPTPEQRERMKLSRHETLFGLYEGVPLTARGAGYNLVLPDKITIFKNPMLHAAESIDQLRRMVHNTVWHEIAHHFGLDHGQIDYLERR